jgi:adenine phosphoribosyltransferase
MATLNSLKQALRAKATEATPLPTRLLSDEEYSAGFNVLLHNSEWTTYRDFIIPQLSELIDSLLDSRTQISVLEIGPGPKSVLGYLPNRLRHSIKKYTTYEPNGIFAAKLKQEAETLMPCLESPRDIRPFPFVLESDTASGDENDMYDVVLFCHSMYSMHPKKAFIEQAVEFLVEGGIVAVFHRDEPLHLDGLVCQRTAAFPAGLTRVEDNDEVLDTFTPFIAGYIVQDVSVDKAMRCKWRKICRDLGRRDKAHPDHLFFDAPNIMMSFTRDSTSLPELTAQVPSMPKDWTVKNRETRSNSPASVMRPTKIQHVQNCVRWALKHRFGLTIVGGGHSAHCLSPNSISVNMDAFDQVHVVDTEDNDGNETADRNILVVAEAGCKTNDIVRKTMAAGLTVPLGSRPSVGAGLWLQGGIGHLARLHGLTCDAIVGAILVSVKTGEVLCVGCVPSQHQPIGAIRPDNESDLLWALKGAGTNFGITVKVTFKAHPAPTYSIQNWVLPLSDELEAQKKLSEFDKFVATGLPRNCSADAYLYWDAGQLRLGVTTMESSPDFTFAIPTTIGAPWGMKAESKFVDGVGLFDTEMYVSRMHGGHSGGKTSSFKRCLFFRDIGQADVTEHLVAAVLAQPSPLCYLHLLQGGGAVSDVATDATAFGCRDWDFACVITGVWPREKDRTAAAESAIRWVYNVVADMLPLSKGVYGADLGPDPRDSALAAKAFGPNRPRLIRLKHSFDPHNVLSNACQLPKAPMEPKLIILVTGDSCAGKDYCADIWVSAITSTKHYGKYPTALSVSISSETKREYAAATGADLNLLLESRTYKEQHRPALTTFFQRQVQQRPRLPEEHFLRVVHGAGDVDMLLITGMRDEAPVAALSHLVPNSRLLQVHVQGSERMRRARQGRNNDSDGSEVDETSEYSWAESAVLDHRPDFIFDNNALGDDRAQKFAEQFLSPFLDPGFSNLYDMVGSVADFPRPGIDFRHVLAIPQHLGGLTLCTSLLEAHFVGEWSGVRAVVSCEAGGFIFASALALQVRVPFVPIREAGKLPPPVVAADKPTSHISFGSNDSKQKRIEMERCLPHRGTSVVVVDDVLATGETLYAMLQLLIEVGIDTEQISVMVVAEFPVHRGRDFLRRRGFGKVSIRSLLVFSGA